MTILTPGFRGLIDPNMPHFSRVVGSAPAIQQVTVGCDFCKIKFSVASILVKELRNSSKFVDDLGKLSVGVKWKSVSVGRDHRTIQSYLLINIVGKQSDFDFRISHDSRSLVKLTSKLGNVY